MTTTTYTATACGRPLGYETPEVILCGLGSCPTCYPRETTRPEREELVEALRECAESLSRLPDVDGAYRVTVLTQARRLLARIDGAAC